MTDAKTESGNVSKKGPTHSRTNRSRKQETTLAICRNETQANKTSLSAKQQKKKFPNLCLSTHGFLKQTSR